MAKARTAGWLLALSLAALPGAALADVKAGVDAWTAGDYDRAVAEWRDPAARGDADAQFNLAQAYRLGRGVEKNLAQAEVYYAKAAEQGHLKAADNLGLLMFQSGRREDAMPYIAAAAGRGDPRAEYLLGIAHFNGDLVEKDWPRAYALLTLANAAGLPQAASAIAQMDEYIPLEERQQAQSLAAQMKTEADARRSAAFAAADLDAADTDSGAVQPLPEPVRVARADTPPSAPPPAPAPSPVAAPPPSAPQPNAPAPVTPSVAAAQAAIAEAARVTGTQSPAEAGASFARPAMPPVPAPSRATPVARPAPKPTPAAAPATGPATATGPWKVQLGAFSVGGNAEKLWKQLAGRSELQGRTRVIEQSGRLTKLLAGGYPSREAANAACASLKRSGQGCLVTR